MKKNLNIALFIAISLHAFAQGTVQNGLVAAYKFNSNIIDSSGNAHHATAVGNTSFSPDRFGCANKSFLFTHTLCVLNVNPSLQFDIGYSDYSASFWAKYNANAIDIIPFLINDSNSSGEWFQFQNYGLGNAMAFAVKSGNAASQTAAIKNNIKDGLWHHYVGVRRNINQLDLYFDGVLASTIQNNSIESIDSYSPNMLPIEIGSAVGSNRYNDGSLDDLYFYNRALTPAEVLTLYREANTCPTIVGTELVKEQSENGFMLSPNPTTHNSFRITASEAHNSLIITINDLSGKLLHTYSSVNIAAEEQIELPLYDIAAGTYLISLQTPQSLNLKKLIVIK